MNLRLSGSAALLRDTAVRFFSDPARRDETSDELWQAMSDLGWLGIAVPEASGGSGGDVLHLAVVLEELGRHAATAPFLESVSASLLAQATDPLPADLVRDLTAGTLRAATVFPQEEARRAAAREDGDLLTLGPTLVTWATEADVLLLLCNTREASVLVTVDANIAGLTRSPVRTFDGVPAALVELKGVRLSDASAIGSINGTTAEELLAIVKVLRVINMLGAAEHALASAIAYVKERHQFGRRLSSFQAIQHTAANLAIELDATRMLAYEAVANASARRPFLRSAAAAVIRGARACETVVLASAHLHGGMGFMKEFPVHRYYTRAKAEQIRLGSRSELRRWAAPMLLDATPRMPFPEITAR